MLQYWLSSNIISFIINNVGSLPINNNNWLHDKFLINCQFKLIAILLINRNLLFPQLFTYLTMISIHLIKLHQYYYGFLFNY